MVMRQIVKQAVCLFERNAGKKRCRKDSQWLIKRFFGGDIKNLQKAPHLKG